MGRRAKTRLRRFEGADRWEIGASSLAALSNTGESISLIPINRTRSAIPRELFRQLTSGLFAPTVRRGALSRFTFGQTRSSRQERVSSARIFSRWVYYKINNYKSSVARARQRQHVADRLSYSLIIRDCKLSATSNEQLFSRVPLFPVFLVSELPLCADRGDFFFFFYAIRPR